MKINDKNNVGNRLIIGEGGEKMERRYMNIKELARYLCFSENTIRKWVRYGSIPFSKINGGIRFSRDGIDRWVNSK